MKVQSFNSGKKKPTKNPSHSADKKSVFLTTPKISVKKKQQQQNMGKKKVQVNPFERRSRCRSADGADMVRDEEANEGQLADTSLSFTPTAGKMEAALTIQFKANIKISRGDTVLIRLSGFKGGHSGIFALEHRDHPENKDFRDCFHAYWCTDTAPKGTPPPASITLQCRKSIEAETLVIIGVPESVRIQIPEKLPMSSQKVKIEANLRHNNTNNGKIPKMPMTLTTDVPKKRALDDVIKEVSDLLQKHFETSQFDDDEQQLAIEVTSAELDQIWEAARETSELKLGIVFEMLDTTVFKNYATIAPLVKTVADTYLSASKKRALLALEKELATNLGVKVGCVVALEDALFTIHASRYPELTRGAILALRLFTCEAHDLARIFAACGVNSPSCIYREINSALRCGDAELVAKWTHTIAALSTCCSKLTHIPSDLIPVLYRGVKELPADAITHIATLRKDSFYVFPGFTTWTTSATPVKPAHDEQFATAPDSAVLFEVHGPVDGIELNDISQYPQDNKWMLPMFSSFSVVSVESLPADRNNMLHVALRMTGSLGGALRDDRFPEDHRSVAAITIKKSKTDSMLQAEKAQWLAKAIYANYKLNALKRLHPQHAQTVHFLDKYAEVHRGSLARAAVEESTSNSGVKWQQQIVVDPVAAAAAAAAASSMGRSTAAAAPKDKDKDKDGAEGAGAGSSANAATVTSSGGLVPASWDIVGKKQSVLLEMAFLQRQIGQKQFNVEGLQIDFEKWTADFGKGLRNIRRLIGRNQTHPFQQY